MKRVFTHIGFSMAITLIVLNLVGVDIALIVSIGLAMLLVASLIITRFRQAIAVPLCLGSALFACLVFMLSYSADVAPQIDLANKTAQVEFYCVDAPQRNGSSYAYTVKTISIEGEKLENPPQKIKLRFVTDEELPAEPYQIIKADLKFGKIGKNAFSSYGYWANDIFLSSRAEGISVTKDRVSSPWKSILKLRWDIISTLSSTLVGDLGGLAVALITGYRELISDELYNAFKLSGTTHLIAVSGFHLTIATFGLLVLLNKTRKNRKILSAIGIMFVLVCIGMAGFSKSVIRAGIMMIVLFLGKSGKRRADSLNSLGIAVSLICLNPFAVSDVGAQLSVVSTLAMILYFEYVNRNENKLSGIIKIPTVITIANMPVMYFFFGYVSVIGMALNTVIPIIGGASLVMSVLTYFSVKLNLFTAELSSITEALINLLIEIIKRSASVSFSTVNLNSEFGFAIAGVFFIIAGAVLVGKKRLIKPFACICAVILVSAVGIGVYENYNSVSMLVTEDASVAVVDENEAYVYGVNSNGDNYFISSFLLSNGIECKKGDNNEIVFGDNVHYMGGTQRFKIKDVIISRNGSVDANIIIYKDVICDDYGLINLENGDIIYRIYNDSTYKATLVDAFGG